MASSGPDRSLLLALLARQRAVSAALLLVLILLCWAWLASGAGMGMPPTAALWPQPADHSAMPGMTAAEHAAMAGLPVEPMSVAWSARLAFLIFAMWWVMMAAMMLPAAAPMILLFARASRHGAPTARPPTAAFTTGYLLCWGLFSLGATALQWRLDRTGLLAPMQMASSSRWISATILLLAGLYQFSAWKDACLRQCAHPAQFLSRHFRPGRSGALRMGLIHGAYCVGCCWLLMALLFVVGVMNLAWVALLTLFVGLEKLHAKGPRIARIAGAMLLIGSAVIALG